MLKLLLTAPAQDIDQLVKIMGVEIGDLVESVFVDGKSITGSNWYDCLLDMWKKVKRLKKLNNSNIACIKKAQQAFAVREVPAYHVE